MSTALNERSRALLSKAKSDWTQVKKRAAAKVTTAAHFDGLAFALRPLHFERSGVRRGVRAGTRTTKSPPVEYGLDERGVWWTMTSKTPASKGFVERVDGAARFCTRLGTELQVAESTGEEAWPETWRWASKYGGGEGRTILRGPRVWDLHESVWDGMQRVEYAYVDVAALDDTGAPYQVLRRDRTGERLLWLRPGASGSSDVVERIVARALDEVAKCAGEVAAVVLIEGASLVTMTLLDRAEVAVRRGENADPAYWLNPAEYERPEVDFRLPPDGTSSHESIVAAARVLRDRLPGGPLVAVSSPDMATLHQSLGEIYDGAPPSSVTLLELAAKPRRAPRPAKAEPVSKRSRKPR